MSPGFAACGAHRCSQWLGLWVELRRCGMRHVTGGRADGYMDAYSFNVRVPFADRFLLFAAIA